MKARIRTIVLEIMSPHGGILRGVYQWRDKEGKGFWELQRSSHKAKPHGVSLGTLSTVEFEVLNDVGEVLDISFPQGLAGV